MERNEAYSVLSDLIYKGFLAAELDLDGKLFVFKTINDKEYELIKLYAGSSSRKDYAIRFNVYFLAFSVFMVDRRNMLINRDNNISILSSFFVDIPDLLFNKIFQDTAVLRNASFDAIRYLEGFSYTSEARGYWRQLGGNCPALVQHTGIPGTTEIGMNTFQENWAMINRSLDAEEQYNQNFSLALMVASSSNPKGARSIRSQHDGITKNSDDRRKKLAKEGFIDVKKHWSEEGWAAPVDTTEELLAELDRQMNGIKDRHDLFIEEMVQRTHEEADRKAREAETRIKRSREGLDGVFIDGNQRAMTDDEVKKMLSKKNETLVTVPSEEDVSEEDKKEFLKRTGTRVLTA